MKFAAISVILGSLSALALAQCDCKHNGDAGRWRDAMSPSDRLRDICNNGGGCHSGEQGRMCVNGDLGRCDCAVPAASSWQSWSGDWFLWSAIDCDGLSITIN